MDNWYKIAQEEFIDFQAKMKDFLVENFSSSSNVSYDDHNNIVDDADRAIYWFAHDHHGGPGSKFWTTLTNSPYYTDQPFSHEEENVKDMYDALVEEFGEESPVAVGVDKAIEDILEKVKTKLEMVPQATPDELYRHFGKPEGKSNNWYKIAQTNKVIKKSTNVSSITDSIFVNYADYINGVWNKNFKITLLLHKNPIVFIVNADGETEAISRMIDYIEATANSSFKDPTLSLLLFDPNDVFLAPKGVKDNYISGGKNNRTLNITKDEIKIEEVPQKLTWFPSSITLEELKKHALFGATLQGHAMGKWEDEVKADRTVSLNKCILCDKWVMVNTKPLPTETDVGGSAIATNCEPREYPKATPEELNKHFGKPEGKSNNWYKMAQARLISLADITELAEEPKDSGKDIPDIIYVNKSSYISNFWGHNFKIELGTFATWTFIVNAEHLQGAIDEMIDHIESKKYLNGLLLSQEDIEKIIQEQDDLGEYISGGNHYRILNVKNDEMNVTDIKSFIESLFYYEKIAWEAAEKKGHQMGQWDNGTEMSVVNNCKICGKSLIILDVNKNPDEAIGGAAYVESCIPSVPQATPEELYTHFGKPDENI